MTEEELIREFQYNGCDITDYMDKIEVVSTNESKFIDGRKTAIATTRTFSCTNLLIFSKEFAYLAHMFPSEMVGMNNDFDNRLEELKKLFNHFKPSEINVLIAPGESVPHNDKQDFHNLTYIYEKLNTLKNYCSEVNLLPIMKSKYLLFDLEKFLLYIDNPTKEIIDINGLINKNTEKRK